MTYPLSDRESRNRFVCPTCGTCHNWISHPCTREKTKSPDEAEQEFLQTKYMDMLKSIYKPEQGD